MGFGNSSDLANQARLQQIQQQGIINTGTAAINKAYSGFNDNFYNQRAKAYEAYAAPQFGQQYQQTRNNMIYGLANRGLLGSGAAQEQANALAKERNTQQQNIADTGVAQANALKQQVENQRSSLVSQLAATSDPAQTTQQALSTASGFQAPSTFQPIGPLFQNFANTYLANQYAQAYGPYAAYYAPRQPYTGGSSFLPPTAIYH